MFKFRRGRRRRPEAARTGRFPSPEAAVRPAQERSVPLKDKHGMFGPREQRVLLCGLLMFVGFIFIFTKLPERIEAMENQRKYEGEFYEFAQLFSEIYAGIRERYVTETDSKKLFEGAVRGMFAALDDPHSQWLSPDSLAQLEKDTEGEFSGVGLNITMHQNVLTVIAPIPGSPAARAGMAPWDRIMEIDGQSTEGITLLEAVKKLTGPQGSSVKVKVFREGHQGLMDFTLTRDVIKIQSVFHKTIGGEIGYVRLSKFAEDTSESVKEALEDFHKQGVKGVVVDLRYNSGGLLDKVIEICGYFLPKDQIVVSTKGRNGENSREYYAKGEPICDLPLVVLVNNSSASASEIFAGAMQDTKRGFIVGPQGENTFGKGSVQTIGYLKHSLERDENGQPKANGLRLTTALYYTPSGRTIHKVGVKPDFEVALTRDHQIALLRHGLLGDPDTSRLATPAPPAGETKKDEGAGEKPEAAPKPASDDAPTTPAAGAKPDGKKPAEVKNGGEDFKDILLDEAVKYLRMMIVIEERIKA